MSIDRPAKLATPATALMVAVPLIVPPLGFALIARVIEAVLPVTVFPKASRTATAGWAAQTVPPVPPPGCVVKTTCVGEAAVMLNVPLVAALSPELFAVSV